MTTRRHRLMIPRAAMVAAVLIGMLAGVVPAFAQDGGTQSIFVLGAGSRAISLGRAFVASADDASAVYWNPGALKNVGSTQFMAMYMPLYGDFTGADYTYFGFVYPTLSAGAFGVGYTRVGSTFDRYDASSVPLGEGTYSESQLMFSYAFERHLGWLGGTLATGGTFKISRQTIDPFSSNAPGVDLGFRYTPDWAQSIALGLTLQDLAGSQYKLDLESDSIDRTIMAGLGYTKKFEGGAALRFMLQYDRPERADPSVHAGAEYAFSRFVSLRLGYDKDTATFGLGIGAFNYGLDYAFYSRNDPGTNQAVTFTANIGKSLDEKREEIAQGRAAEEKLLIQKAFESRIATHRTQAQQLEASGDYAGALTEWQIVLGYAPDDPEALARSAAARDQVIQQQAATVRDAETQAVVRARFAHGLDLFNQNDFLGARNEWHAVLDADSSNAAARDYLRRTQARIDELVTGHIEHARTLENQNRLTESIAEWNNVQQYDPNNAQAKAAIDRIRGKIESVSQDYAATQRRLRTVTLYNDALQKYNAGQYQDAMKDLNELLTLQPDHADAKKLMALAKRRTTPLTDAEKAKIREFYLAGMQHFSKDEYAQAITEWEKILELDPTNESVQKSIDEARERLNKVQGHK
jgi:tetratricopeptide (TPR) repeat protein